MSMDFACGFGMAVAATPIVAADPNAAALKLALFGQGSDGTTQPASDRGAKALTWYGDAAIRTAQSRFYGSSLAFDGTGDYISAGASSDFVVAGDFRLSCWIKTPGISGSSLGAIAACFRQASPWDGWEFGVMPNTGYLSLYVSTGSDVTNKNSISVSDNAWHFVEGGRSGSTLYLSVDGVVQAVGSFSGSPSTYNTMTIGANSAGAERLTGYVQDLLLYNGVGPRTANFTPPTAGYADTYL